MNNFLEASKELHKTDPTYGRASAYTKKGSLKHELTIPKAVYAAHQIQPIKNILDHGCGQGGLVTTINEDPSITARAYGYMIQLWRLFPNSLNTTLTSLRQLTCLSILGEIISMKPLPKLKKLTQDSSSFALT